MRHLAVTHTQNLPQFFPAKRTLAVHGNPPGQRGGLTRSVVAASRIFLSDESPQRRTPWPCMTWNLRLGRLSPSFYAASRNAQSLSRRNFSTTRWAASFLMRFALSTNIILCAPRCASCGKKSPRFAPYSARSVVWLSLAVAATLRHDFARSPARTGHLRACRYCVG